MRTCSRLFAMTALGAFLAGGLRAQTAADLATLCSGISDVKLGQWASFDATGVSYTEGGPPEAGSMRLATVGSQRVGDTTLYWFEVRFSGKDHSGIIQILTPSLAAGMAAPHALIIKAGSQPAMRIPGQMAGMVGKSTKGNTSALDWASGCNGGHVLGWESVTVPAGTFRALHVRFDGDAEVWGSRDVPFGLIKTRRKDGGMALRAYGSDAKSSITEKPLEMPGMTMPH